MSESAGATPTPEPEADAPRKRGPKPVGERVEKLEGDVNEMKGMLALLVERSVAQPTPAPSEPEPEPQLVVQEWGDGDVWTYSSMHKDLTLQRVIGERDKLVNGQIARIPDEKFYHFTNGSYTTQDPDIRDWIEQHEMFRDGRIIRGVTLVPKPLHIHEGPKTSTRPHNEPRVVRPAGALSANLNT